jgi:hypothetical protein
VGNTTGNSAHSGTHPEIVQKALRRLETKRLTYLLPHFF